MATKVKEIVTDVLFHLSAHGEDEPIEPATAAAVIRALNRMMAAFAAEGINIGYTNVDSLDDLITVPSGAIDPIIFNLAKKYAPQVKTEGGASIFVIAEARAGRKVLFDIAFSMPQMEYPDTLPIGSGNSDDTTNAQFYPDLESTILSETNGSVSLEDLTEEG